MLFGRQSPAELARLESFLGSTERCQGENLGVVTDSENWQLRFHMGWRFAEQTIDHIPPRRGR